MRFWRTPLDQDRFHRPHGRVLVIVERCKGCGFCVEYCPLDVLRISERFNKKGYHYPEVAQAGVCVDCNLCEIICPEFAIYSENVSAEEDAGAPAGRQEGAGAGGEQGGER